MRKFFIGMLASFVLLLNGCVPTSEPNIKSDSELSKIEEKESSIVFGKIEWMENGEKKEFKEDGLMGTWIKPNLMNMVDESKIECDISEGGEFVWSLPPGKYLMHKIHYRDSWSGSYFIVPKIAFTIPEKGKIYYIGTLKGDSQTKRDLIGGLSGTTEFTVQDNYSQDVRSFKKKFRTSSKKIKKSLMIHDKRLPQTPETTAEYNIAMSLLNAVLMGM